MSETATEPAPGVFATAGVFSVALGAVALAVSPAPLFGTVALLAGVVCLLVDAVLRRPGVGAAS